MTEGPLGGAAFNNEFGRPNLLRLLPRLRADRRRRAARLSQADHDRRRPRRDRRAAQTHKIDVPGRHAADPARRPRHAHRHGRRRGELDGRRHQHRRARLRFGAARQPRDPAPRAGGHQPLLGARRRTTRSWRSTTSAPAACQQRVPRAGRRRRPRRALRPAQGAARGDRPGAEGDLVQREPGALRAGDRARTLLPLFERCASASAARSRSSAWRPTSAQLVLDDGAGRRARRSTCRWTCCSASRRRCTATCSASRARVPAAATSPASSCEDACFDVLRHPTVASQALPRSRSATARSAA